MILIKMNRLGIDPQKYKNLERHDGKFSYVLINPPNDFSLKTGDIIYLLKTGYKKESSPNFKQSNIGEEESLLKLNLMKEETSERDMNEMSKYTKRNSFANLSYSLKQSLLSKSPPKSRLFLTSSVNSLKTSSIKNHDIDNLECETPFK